MRAARLARLPRQAGSHLLVDRGLQIGAELFVELLLDALVVEQRAKATKEAIEREHHSPREASRILAIAMVCTSQSRVSRLSVDRPGAVSSSQTR